MLPDTQSRVLIVDDLPQNLELLGEVLRAEGVEVIAAGNGERALLLAERIHPDLVLLDVMMPGTSGHEVCRQLKSNPLTCEIPIIFLTARSEKEDTLHGFELGAVDYVTKPFVREELLARVRTHLELSKKRVALERYLGIVDARVLSCVTDLQGTITQVSQAFCDLIGVSREELIGRSHDLIHPSEISSSLQEGKSWHGEINTLSCHAQELYLHLTIDPIRGRDGKIIACHALYDDITDKKRIEQMSITDKLTTLYNRFKLDSVLAYELQQSLRNGRPFALILLDLDDFKKINDRYGHQCGDQVLQGAATLFKQQLRTSDTAGRWGGEEFLAILPETSLEDAFAVAEKIRLQMEAYPFEAIGRVTCSLGVAAYSDQDTIDSLLVRADDALYQSKRQGKNKTTALTQNQGESHD